MARGIIWTKDETNKAFKLFSEGKTYEEIGTMLGRTKYGVEKHMVKERKRAKGTLDTGLGCDNRNLFQDIEKSKLTDYKEADAINFRRFREKLLKKIDQEKMIFNRKVVYHNENYIVIDLGNYRKTLYYNEIYEQLQKKGA